MEDYRSGYMKKCRCCGAPAEPGAEFCTYCGSRLADPKPPLVVRRMPMFLIAVLTLGFFMASMFTAEAEMEIALIVSCVPGVVLLFLIYRLDRIEPEPLGLLLKLFFGGAIISTISAALIESVLEGIITVLFGWHPILYCFAAAFIMAAATEELCKYAVLKAVTWRHPAFNYRFDGVVYSTTVAIGFEIFENFLYLIDSTADTAFTRAAFPGHCIFGIYMGYYYGQAKTLELRGDLAGAKAMRRKGIITAILIHGWYDFICFLAGVMESEIITALLGLGLVAAMVVLNVTAYKNIKKYAYEDEPV
ncbi:putative membrane protein [Lachnospiraceae bacterium JC7]|nr:putative membrane protein [Lachnospiraceae bacterium JC7]